MNKINICQKLVNTPCWPMMNPICGLKYLAPPIKYDDITIPDRPKLRMMEKIPQYPPNLKPPKMQKKLKFMYGPEMFHTELIHKQYGIMALCGGRLRWGHFEMMRLGIGRKIDVNKMFAIWRVDAPWQPITKKGQGQRMGGGKGAIDHYVTPIKSGRIILELAGRLEYKEAFPILNMVAQKLPFKAQVVSQELLIKMQEKNSQENLNPITMKYMIQNNLNGCNNWTSPRDYKFVNYF